MKELLRRQAMMWSGLIAVGVVLLLVGWAVG
jgi:hypothetical protein